MDDSTDAAGRDWARIGLVVGVLVAAVTLTLVMPAFAVDGLAGSPLERLLPGESADISSGSGGSGSGQLGALNPGSGTGVGGEIGLNSDTFASTNTEIHFTVTSTQRTYWRTAAYGTYTGSGWERSTETQPVDGAIERTGPDGQRIDWEVTLKKGASAAPTAYRPALIRGLENPAVTANGAIQPGSTLSPGATIEGVSYAPRDDVGLLRSTDESYPSAVEQRYTQLPEDTPDRIASRTAEVFNEADATDPYEKAVAVQEYLRSTKEYSLDVGERSESIADTFLFEMDAGYCEYFATSMAVMLRSQDIPTRYVVGYSSGQKVGDNTYEVRGMNAHAWVEVYFEDVGWVRFDPTPGSERLEAQQQALEELNQEFDLSEIGSPGEQFEPGGTTDTVDSDDGLQTSLNRTAVPGTAVELTVTYDGRNVPGVEVLFNGESVGITRGDGTVIGIVPDAQTLNVSIREGDGTTPQDIAEALFGSDSGAVSTPDLDGTDGILSAGRSSPATAGAGVGRSLGSGSAEATLAATQTDEPEDSHPIERTASIVVSGEPAPGSDLLLTVRIGDVVLDGATVSVDDEVVGTTDENGQITIGLPDSPGEITVSAERDSLSGERTIQIPELTMAVDTGLLGASAAGTATVTARLDGDPVTGVPVLLGGEEVAVTGPNGTAQVNLPVRPSATIAIEAGGQRKQTTLTGLLYVPAAVGVGLVAVFGATAGLLARRGVSLGEAAQRVRAAARALGRTVRRGFVAAVTNGDRYVGIVGGQLAGLFTGRTTPSGIWRRFTRWIGRVLTIGSSESNHRRDPEAEVTVREAWNRFLDDVSASSAETQTPGELAAHAIEEDNLPEQPVTELRDTFREVEYGSRSPSDRLQRVQEAIEEIERKGQ
ncbi:transglutaminase TgpA family protein [Halovenus halobia]|uniref:transglutaminase TgpA family protein n=1 Tax=Halovenus halobia TaxID=3396622 RepID=UPI003F55E33B